MHVTVGWFFLFVSTESQESIFMNPNSERFYGSDKHIQSYVELESFDKEGFGHLLLTDPFVFLREVYLGPMFDELDALSLAARLGFHNKKLLYVSFLLINHILLQLVHFCGQ